ncbi:hypothetical protein [Noviherbaspirillum soli]|uniref:hypothetical protein n=1 Tax=Noviherbaspirillum soli TaxID=1064518 RepID=UPI00188B096A|nr:hypothetical protein [Noviherbaspirillum soli]
MNNSIQSVNRHAAPMNSGNSVNDHHYSDVGNGAPNLQIACQNRNFFARQQAVNSTSAGNPSFGANHAPSPQVLGRAENTGQPRYKSSMNQRFGPGDADPYSPYATPQGLNAGNNWTLSASSVTQRF